MNSKTAVSLDLKITTFLLIVSFSVSFILRTSDTIFPAIFQNEYIAKFTMVTNVFFILIQLLFFIYFLKSYVSKREQVLKKASFLAILGSASVAFIHLKHFCLVFKLNFITYCLHI